MAENTLSKEKQAPGYSPNEPNPTLVDAWQAFADYDHNANLTSKRFRKLRLWVLALSVIATGFAILYEVGLRSSTAPLLSFWPTGPSLQSVGKWIVIILPITVSMLLTWSSKFERGMNWILLRGASESIKGEIFLFRAKVGVYSDQFHFRKPREVRLAEKIKQINERLMKTEVNKDGLHTYKGDLPPLYGSAEGDHGFGFLYADEYLKYRLEDQMNFYKRKVEKLGEKFRTLNFRIIFFGALGTFLAAIGFEIWVAFTTAIVGSYTSYLDYNQYENTLTSYNQTARDLESLRMWWRAVPDIEKEQHILYERLVLNCETIMTTEHASWIQNMQDALEELYEEDEIKKEEMMEIVEKFQNDPDTAYFVDEDEDYISAEELDALGFTAPSASSAPIVTSTSAKAKKESVAEVEEIIFEDEANNPADDFIASMTMDFTEDDIVDVDTLADEDDIVDFMVEATDQIEDENSIDMAEAMMDNLKDGLDDIETNNPEPMDIEPDMLNDLFGDIGGDDDNDDLADLFGDGS